MTVLPGLDVRGQLLDGGLAAVVLVGYEIQADVLDGPIGHVVAILLGGIERAGDDIDRQIDDRTFLAHLHGPGTAWSPRQKRFRHQNAIPLTLYFGKCSPFRR
jgi:hypothetical protein